MIIAGFGHFENATRLLHAQFPKRGVGGEKAGWGTFTREMSDIGARREIFVCRYLIVRYGHSGRLHPSRRRGRQYKDNSDRGSSRFFVREFPLMADCVVMAPRAKSSVPS